MAAKEFDNDKIENKSNEEVVETQFQKKDETKVSDPNKPKDKPKLNYKNRKVNFYIVERKPLKEDEIIRLKVNDPESSEIDFADYQRIFFEDFGNMATYNRGIFNRKTPQRPEVYKAKLHTQYDDLTITSIKDIKAYLSKKED